MWHGYDKEPVKIGRLGDASQQQGWRPECVSRSDWKNNPHPGLFLVSTPQPCGEIVLVKQANRA